MFAFKGHDAQGACDKNKTGIHGGDSTFFDQAEAGDNQKNHDDVDDDIDHQSLFFRDREFYCIHMASLYVLRWIVHIFIQKKFRSKQIAVKIKNCWPESCLRAVREVYMQTVQIENKQETKLQLVKDLKNFGLNPQEWEIDGRQSDIFTIQSKKDKSFILLGTIRRLKESVSWQNITLASL